MRAVSVEALAGAIRAGDKVFVSGSAGEPIAVTELLATTPELAAGAEFHCSFIPGVNPRNLANENRRMTVGFMQGGFRKSLTAGHVRFAPMSYTATLQHLCSDDVINTVLVQVSPPDSDGYCSLGLQGEFLPQLLSRKPRVLAVLNPNVPVLAGSPKLAMADIEAYCESDLPLATYDPGKPNAVAQAIAEHVAALIPNGAALQCGLGKIPNQLMAALADHRQLRIHSGMASDGIVSLLDAGALDLDATVTSIVALGSSAFYRRLPEFKKLIICGVEACHSAQVLAQVPKLFAVNSSMELDLFGQANAEMLGGRFVSGPGGLPDFAAGARAQHDGCSIIALPAADPTGEQSRIVARLDSGVPVSVPQYLVDVVVTEYGSAYLRGADMVTRAERLVAIAHPDHRDRLFAEFEQRFLL